MILVSFCLCWSAVEKDDILNKLYDCCIKDKDYLEEILFEYLELLEDQENGLNGIKETLEDRNSFNQYE